MLQIDVMTSACEGVQRKVDTAKEGAVGSEVTRIPDSGGDQASLGQRGDPPNPSHLNPCSQHGKMWQFGHAQCGISIKKD